MDFDMSDVTETVTVLPLPGEEIPALVARLEQQHGYRYMVDSLIVRYHQGRIIDATIFRRSESTAAALD